MTSKQVIIQYDEMTVEIALTPVKTNVIVQRDLDPDFTLKVEYCLHT